MTTEYDTASSTMLRTAVTMSAISLLLSCWVFVQSLDDGDLERSTEQRLACLEVPGPNDCGLDGR